VHGAVAIAAQRIADERPIAALGDARQRGCAREEMREDMAAGKAGAGLVVLRNARQVIAPRGPHQNARRRLDGLPRASLGAPARERIDIAKPERQIDRPPQLGGIEAGRDALRLDLGEALAQQP
jgi:hypothetical protein